jgi:type IX secretion system PorP/SprF family membrane protein
MIKALHNINKFKVLFFLLAFITKIINVNAQQEGNQTLFMYNPLLTNPGAAGIRGNTSYTLTHRSQWLGFKGAPTQQAFSVSTPAFSDRLGFGFTLENRRTGIFESQTLTMAWGYSLIKTPNFNCRAGLQGLVKRKVMHFDDLEEAAQFINDRSFQANNSSKIVSNFGMGLYMTYKDAFFGVSVPSYLPNVIGINPSSPKTAAEAAHYYAQGGFRFKITEGVKLQPSAMMRWVNHVPWAIDANVMLIVKNKIDLGISYRAGKTTLANIGESADITLMFQVNDKLGIGASYDWLLAPVSKYSFGSAEIMLRYDVVEKKEVVFSNPRSFF